MTNSTDLVPYEPSALSTSRAPAMIRPLTTASDARSAIDAYEQLKGAIVRPDDWHQDSKGRKYLKKSFWRRVATCFGVSLEMAREEYLVEADSPVYGYSVIYRAIAPNGQSVEGDGLCMSNERAGMRRHDVRATAHTRAKNRAISDLVGGGEVSAEEITEDRDESAPALSWQDVYDRAGELGANKAQQLAMKGKYKTVAAAWSALDRKEREQAQLQAAATPPAQAPAEEDPEPDMTFTVDAAPEPIPPDPDAPISHDLRNLRVPATRP